MRGACDGWSWAYAWLEGPDPSVWSVTGQRRVGKEGPLEQPFGDT